GPPWLPMSMPARPRSRSVRLRAWLRTISSWSMTWTGNRLSASATWVRVAVTTSSSRSVAAAPSAMASWGADRMPATASARIRDCIGTLLLRAHPRTRNKGGSPRDVARALAGARNGTRIRAGLRSTRIRLQWEGWWPRSRRRARAGIAAAMPSASQSDRVDGPLLRGRSPDWRVEVVDFGRGAFPCGPVRAWTVADALARLAYRCGGSAGMVVARRRRGARRTSPASRFNPLAQAAGSPRSGEDCTPWAGAGDRRRRSPGKRSAPGAVRHPSRVRFAYPGYAAHAGSIVRIVEEPRRWHAVVWLH